MHDERTQIPFHHLGIFLVVFVAFLAWFPSPQVRTIQQVAAANCTPGSDGCSNMALPPADGNINKTVDAKTQQAKEDPEPQNGKSYTTSALIDSKEKAKAAEAAAKKEAADVAAAEAKLNAANAKSNYLPGVAAERAVARNQLLSERVQKAKADAEKKRADEDLKDRETHPGRRRLIGEKGDVIKDCTVSTCKAEDLQGWANKPAADGGAVAPSAGGTSALAPQTSTPLAGTVLSTPGSAGVDPFASQSANSGSGAPAPLAPSASPMDVAKASLGADTTAGQQGPALGAPSGSLGGLSPSGSSGLAGTTLGPANPVTGSSAANTFGQGGDTNGTAPIQSSLFQSAKSAVSDGWKTIEKYAGGAGTQESGGLLPLAKADELRATLESGKATSDVIERERDIAKADVTAAQKAMSERGLLTKIGDSLGGASAPKAALADAQARLDMLNAARHESVLASNQKDLNASLGLDQNYKPVIGPAGDHPGSQPIPLSYRMQNREDLAGAVTVAKDKVDAVIDGEGLKKTTVETKSDVNSNGAIQESVTKRTVLTSPFVEQAVTDAQRAIAERDAFLKQSIADGKIVSTSKGLSAVDSQTGARYQELTTAATDAVSTMERTQQAYERSIARVQDAQGELARAADTYVSNEAAIAKTRADALAAAGVDIAGKPISNAERASVLSQTETRPAQPFSGTEISPLTRSQVNGWFGITRSDSEAYQANSAAVSETLAKAYATQDRQIDALSTCRTDCDSVRASLQNSQQLIQQLESGNYQNAALKDILALRSHQLSAGPDSFGETFRRVSNDIGEVGTAIVKEAWTGKDASGRPVETSAGELLGGLAATLGSGVGHTTAYVLGENNLEGAREALLTGGTTAYAQIRDNEKVAVAEGVIMSSLLTPKFVGPSPVSQMMSDAKAVFSDIARSEYQGLGSSIFGAAERTSARAGSEVAGGIASDASRAAEYSIPYMSRPATEVAGLGGAAAPSIEKIIAGAPAINGAETLTSAAARAETVAGASRVPGLTSLSDTGVAIPRGQSLVGASPLTEVAPVASPRLPGVADIGTSPARAIGTAFDAAAPAEARAITAGGEAAVKAGIPAPTVSNIIASELRNSTAAVPVGALKSSQQVINDLAKAPIAADSAMGKALAEARTSAPLPAATEVAAPRAPPRTLGQWFQDQLGLGKSFSGTSGDGALSEAAAGAPRAQGSLSASAEGVTIKQAKIADALDVVAKEEPVIAQKLLNGEPLSTQAGEVQRLDTVLNANRMRFSSSDFADNVSQVAAEAGAKGEALKQQLASSQKIVAGAADVSAAYAPRENTAVAWAKAEQQLVADIQAGKVTNPLLTYTEFYSKNMQELGGADLFIGQKYGVQALARGENIVATTGAGKTIMEVVEMKLQKALLGDKLFAELAPPKALAASLLEEKLGGQTMAQRLEASGFTPRNITESWAKDQEKAISLIKNRTTDDILILDPETRGAILAHADQTKDAELIAALNKSNRVTVDEYHKWLSNTTANIIGTAGEDAAPAVARIARVDAFTEAVGMKPGTTIGDKGATGWDANLQAFRTEKGWGTAAGDLRLTKAQWEAEQSTQAIMHDARPMIFANQDGVVQINQAGLRELEAKGFPAAGVVGSADNKLVSDSLTRLGQRPGQANGLLLDAEGKITVLDSSRHAQPGLMPQDTDGLIAWVRNQGGDPAKAIQELQSSVRVAQADVYRGVVENGGQIRGMTATYKGVAPLEQARIGNGTTFLSSKEFNPAEQGTILANSRTAVDSQVERMLASGDGQRNIIFAFEDPKLETSYLAQAQAKTGPFKDFTGDIYVQDAFGNMTKNGTPLDKTLSDSLKTGEKRGSVYFTRETEGYDPQGFNSIVTDVRTYEGMGQATGRANRYGMTGEYGATDAFGTTLQDAGGKPLTDASGNLIKGYWPGEKVILADETRMADTIAAAANNPRTLGALKIMEDGGGAGTSLLEKEIAGKRLTSEETVTLYSKLRQADQIENAVKGDLAREIRDERSVRFFDGLSKDSRIAPEHQAIAQDIKSALENQTGAGRDLGGVAAANTKDPADAFLNNLNKNATAEARQAIAEFEARVKASGVAPNTALENQVAAKLEKLDEWSKVDFTKTPLSKGGEAFSSSQSVAEHAATQKRLSQAITSVDMPLERKNVTISVTPEAAPAAVPTLSSFVADSAQGAAKAAVDTSVSTARGVVDGVVHAGAVTAEIAGLLATGDVKKAADAFAGALTEGFSSVIGANENFPTPTVHAQMNVAANDTTVEDVSAARGRIIADAQAKIDAIQASAGTSPQARDEANVNERANAVRAERDSALAQLDTAQQTPPGAVVSPLGTAAKVMTNAVASLVPGLGTASAVSQSSIPTAALKTIQTIADRIAGWLGFGSATDLADVTPGDSLDSTEETNAIAMLNQITERAGMPVLVRNASLAYAAKQYAPVMGFDADDKPLHVPVEGNTPAYRGGKAGYGTAATPGAGQTLVGENLAAGSGFTDFSAVISAWMQSPAHRAVLLNADVHDIGIGYAVVGGEPRWVVMVGVRDFHGTVTEARPVSSLLQDTPTSVSIGGAANEGSLTTAVAVPSSDIEATLRAALPGSMVPASVQNVDPRLQEMDARLQQLEEKIRALQTENGQCIDPSMGQGASAALALVDCSPVSIQQRNEQIASLIQEAQQLDSDLKALKMGPQSAAPAESKMAASPPSPTASVPSTQNITDTGQPGGATAPTARPITQTSAPAEASASKGDGTAVIQYTAPVTPLGQFLVDNALSLAENVSAPFAWRNAAYYRSIKLALDGSDIAPNEPVRLLYHRHAAAALAESHDVMAALESAGVPQATRNDVEAAYEAVTGTYTSITGMVITSRGDIDRPVLSQLDADVAQELTLARQRALESGADVGVIRQAIQRANQQATHDALTLYAIARHYPDGADIVARLAANDPTLITQGQPGTTAQGFVANRTAPTALAQALRAAAFAGLTIAQTLSGTPGSIATTPTPQQQGTSVATQVQQDDMQILAPIIAVAEQARAQAIDAQTPFAAVTPLAQENVRFLDTAFKDTVAGKLADAAERGRRLAILKQVVASRIAAGGLTYPEFLLMNDIGAALTGIQTPLSATREIFPASWQSSQMDSTSQMADFSALALALRGTPAQGFDLDNLMIPVAQKAITARIANYAVARGIHLGGLSAGVLPVAVDGRFFDTFTLLQHDYVHRADFLAAYNALSIAQRAGFRNLYLSWYNSAGSIAHDTRDKADLIFFTLWHEPRMADARWAANGADTSVQSLPYDSSSLASASARLQGGFTSAAAAQEGTLAWRFAQKDNLRIVLPGDLYAMDTPAPGTNVPSQSEVDAKVAAHLQSANDAFRDAFTPIAMALRSPPSVLNRLSMAVSAARASTATSALNSGGAAFFEAMFNAYIAAGRPASATDPRMANEAYLEEATTRMATDIAAAETPEEKAAALANAEEVMRTIARLSTDFDIGPDGRLVSTAVSEAYWRRAQQNLAAAQELNRTTTDRVLAFVRRFAPGLFAGSAVALASGIDPATIADIATQAGSALASYLTPDSTAGGVLATLGLMPGARSAVPVAVPDAGAISSPAETYTDQNSVAQKFVTAERALRQAEANAESIAALTPAEDAYRAAGDALTAAGLGVDSQGDIVNTDGSVIAYQTADGYAYTGTPEWSAAKKARETVAVAPEITPAGAPLLESPDGASVSDAEGKTSTPMPGVPAGLSPLTPAGLKALDTIAQNFQAEDFARANGYTIRSKAPGPIAALFGVPASDWYYKGDTPVGPVENPAAAPDGYTSLPRQVANSSFGKALQVVMPLTLISPAPVLQATVAAGDIASSVVVGSLHVLGDIVGLSPAQSAELPRDVVAQTVVEPKMASPLVLPLISKGPQVDFNVTLAEVYQQSKVKNGNHPGTDLYPWAKYSSEERAMAVAYQTHNPAGMKWPFIFELMGAPGGQPGPYADFFNVARMGADGQVDPTSVIAGKINIVPSKTPFVSFVSFADAEAAMAMKLAYQSEYKNVKTFGDVVRNWVAVDNVSPYLNSGSYTTQAKISGDTPLIRTTNNLIDPAQMARIGIGMPYAEYSNLFKNAGVKHPITGEPVTTAAQLITPEVQRDGLFKVYERVQPGAADAWLADQKRIAAEKATAPASVAKEAAGKSNVSTPPTAPRVTATADEKKEAKAKELVAQWRAKKQVGFGPAVAARLVLDGYDDTQEYVNWRDAAAKQLAGRATVEAPSSTELGIADTLIKLNVRYDVSFAEMAAELSRRGLITSAQYKTLRGFIADGLAQKAGRATTDADRIAADAAIANEMDPTLGHQVTKSGRIYFPGVEYVYELPQGFGTPAERIASKKEGHIMHQVGGWAKDHIARFKTNALRGAGVRVPFLIGDGRGSNDGAVFVFAPNTQEMSWKDNWQGRFLFGGMERESSKLLSTEVGGNAPNIGLTNPLTKAQERAILVNVAFTELAYGFGPAAVVAHNNEENACEGCPGAVLAQELGSVNPYATVSKLIAFADKSVAARAVALAGADAKPSPKTPGTVVIPKGTTLVDSAQFFASLPAATTFLTIAQAGLVSERLISEKVAEAQKTAGMPEVETDQLTGLVKVTEASGEQFVTLKGNGSRLKVVPPKSGNGVYEFRPVEASPVKTASLASIVQAAQKVRNLFGAAKRASLAAKEAAANQRLASLSAAVDEAHAVTSTELANYQTAEQKLAWVTGVVTTHAEFPNGRLTDANLASLPVGATVIVGGWLSDDGLADYANEARRILDFQTGGTPKNFKVVFYTESVTSRSNDMYKPGTSLVKRAVDIAHAREELISVGYPAQRLPNAVNIDSMDGQSEEMLSRVQTILSAGNFDAVIPNNPTPETVALLRNNGVIVPMVLLEDTAKNPDLEQRALAFAQAGERVLVLNFAQGGDRAMQVKFGSPELQANEAVFSTYPNVSMHLGGNAPRILKEATLSVIPPVVLAKNNPTATVPASSVDSNPPALTLKTTLVPDTAVDATQPVTPPVPEAAPTTFQNLGTFAQMQQAGEAIAADLLDQWRALRPAQKLQPLSLIVAGPSAAELEATRVALNQAADIVFYQQLVPQRPVAEKSVQETVAAQPETMPAEGLPGSPSGVAVSAAPSPQRLFNQILAAFAAPAREPAVPAADAGQVTADAATPKLAFWNRVRMLLSWKSTLQPVATPEVTLAAQPPAETAVPIPATEISAATPAVETVSPSQPKLEVASTAVKAPVVKATAAIGPDDIVVLQAQLNKIADATEAMQKAGVEAKAVGARTVTMHGFFGMPTAEDEAVIAKNLRDLRAAFVKIQVAANAIASAQRAMVSEGVLSASHTAVLTTLADQLAPTQTSRAGDSIPQQMIAKVKAFEALPTFTITGSAKTKQTQKESFKTSLASFASQLESLTRANVAETNGIIASAIRNAPVLETVAKPVVAAGSSPEIAAPLNTEGVAVDITPGVDSAEVARIAQLYTQIKGVFDDMKKAGEELTKAKDRAPLRALPTVVIQIRALDTSVRQLTALVGGIVDSPVVDASMAKSLKEELGTIVANVGSMRSALSDVESHPLTSSYRTVLKDTLVEKGPATQIAGESLSVMLEGAIATAQRSVASHGPALTLKTTQVRTPPEVESAPAAPAVSTLTMPEVEAVAPQVVSAPPSTDPLGDALQGAFGAGGFVVGTRIGGVVGRVVANAVRATGAFLSGAVGSVSNTIASIAARVSSGSGSSSTPRPKTYSLNELKAFAADVERPQGKAEREAPSLVISRIDIYSYAEMTPEMKARITAEKPAAGHTFLYRGLRSVWHRPVLASSVMVSLEAQLSAIMEKSLTGALTEEDKQQLLVLTRLLPNERYQFFSDDVGVALKDAYFAEGGELVRIELTGDQAFAYQMDTPSSSSALNQGTNVIIPREAMLSEESAVAVAGRAAPSAETIPTPAASVPVDSAPVVESMPSVRPQPIETSSIAADLARGLLDLASEPAWTPDRPYAATPEPTTQKAPDDMISRLSAAQNTPPAAPVVAAPAQKSVPSLGAAAHPMLSAVWKYTPGSTSVTKTMTDTAAAADYIRGLLTGGISLRGLSWRSVATAAVSAVWNLLPGSASLTKTVTDMGAAADEAKVLLAKVTKAVSGSAASTGGLRATVPILSDFNPIDYELYREYPSISAAAAPVDLHVVGMTPDKTRVLVVGSEKGTPGRMVGLTGGSQVFALPANHAALDQNALASLHFTNERVADDAYAAATAPAAFVSSVGIPGASPAVVIPPPGGAEIGGTPPWRQWAYIILALLGASTIPQDTAVTVETPKAATSVKLAETAPATVKPSTVAKGGAAAPAPAAEAPAANCPPGSYCSAATPPPAAAPTPAPAAGAPAVPGVAGVPAKAAGATPPPAAGLPDASPDKTTPPAARGAGASAVDTGGGAGGGGEKGAGGAVAPAPASGARTPSAPGTTVTPGATKSPGTGSGTGAGTGGGLANSLGGFAQSLKNFFGLGQPSTPTAAATEAPAATPSTAVPATVATTQKPVVMFIVNPEEVAKGASPVLSWLSVNADGCAVYGPTGLLTPRRTERGTIRNLTIARPTEFALVCAATPNTLTDKKVVRVQGDTSTPVSAVITALPEKAAPAERASIPVSTSAPTTPSSAQSQSGGTPTQGAAQPRVQSCSPRMTSNGQVDQSYIDCLYQNGF